MQGSGVIRAGGRSRKGGPSASIGIDGADAAMPGDVASLAAYEEAGALGKQSWLAAWTLTDPTLG